MKNSLKNQFVIPNTFRRVKKRVVVGWKKQSRVRSRSGYQLFILVEAFYCMCCNIMSSAVERQRVCARPHQLSAANDTRNLEETQVVNKRLCGATPLSAAAPHHEDATMESQYSSMSIILSAPSTHA